VSSSTAILTDPGRCAIISTDNECGKGEIVAPTQELETRPKVDPRDEPSAEWGWHGTNWKVVHAGGWFLVFAHLIMLIGNHRGNIENLWLIGIAAGIAVVLLLDLRRRRTSWRQ
jgi:hypothetical protein